MAFPSSNTGVTTPKTQNTPTGGNETAPLEQRPTRGKAKGKKR